MFLQVTQFSDNISKLQRFFCAEFCNVDNLCWRKNIQIRCLKIAIENVLNQQYVEF